MNHKYAVPLKRRRSRIARPLVESLDRRTLLSAEPIHAAAELSPQIARMGAAIYFTGTDAEYGDELWKTDGTAEGTALLQDITPGPASTRFESFRVVDDFLYFVATTSGHKSLWRTDGSEAGTLELFSQDAEVEDADLNLTALGNQMFFLSPTDRSLWVTNGATGGTHLVAPEFLAGTESIDLTAFKGKLYFTAWNAPANGAQSYDHSALFATDGTEAGTMLVDSLPQGRLVSQDLLVCGDRLFFRAVGGRYDILWSSLGESGTTAPVPGMRKVYRVAYELGQNQTWNLWNVNGRLVLGVLSFSRTYLYEVDPVQGAPAAFAQPYDDTYSNPGPTKTALAGPYLFLSSPFGITETDGTAKGTRRLLKGVSGTYEFSFRTTRDIYLSGNNEYPPSPGLWKLPKKAKAPVFVGSEIPLEGTPIISLGKARYFLSNHGSGTALIRQDPGTGSVSGIVCHDLGDLNQKPMAGITVFADLNHNGVLDPKEPSGVSDSDGKYELNFLAPGTWPVYAAGSTNIWKPTTSPLTVIVKADEQTNLPVGIVNADPSCSISGRAYRDLNKDADYDRGEAFRGAEVFLDLNRNGHHDAIEPLTLTDSTGTYRFGRLTEGTYSVRTIASRKWYFGEYNSNWFNPADVLIENGGSGTHDFLVTKKVRVTGYVFDDADGDSARGDGESGLAGQTVTLTVLRPVQEYSVAYESRFKTDETGFYSILVPTLPFYLSADAVGMRQTLNPLFSGFGGDGATISANFGFTTMGSISGGVSIDQLKSPTGLTDSSAVADCQVVLTFRSQLGQTLPSERTVKTDANGAFDFGPLKPGTYDVRLRPKDSMLAVTSPNSQRIIVDSSRIVNVSFTIARSWLIRGNSFADSNLNRKLDAGEAPLAGTLVFADDNYNDVFDDGELSTRSDKNGTYRLNGLTGLSKRIVLIPPSGWRSTRRAELVPNSAGVAEYDAGFTDTASVAGTVFSDQNSNGKLDAYELGEIYSHWQVWLDDDNNGAVNPGESFVRYNLHSSGGRFKFDNLAPGTHWLRVKTPANTALTTASRIKVVLKPGEMREQIDFGLHLIG